MGEANGSGRGAILAPPFPAWPAAGPDPWAAVLHLCPLPACLNAVGDNRFLDANDHFLRLTGYGRDELIGRTPEAVGVWDGGERRAAIVAGSRQPGGLPDFETEIVTKTGERRHLLASTAPVPDGGPGALLSVLTDVTAQKEQERALRAVVTASERQSRELALLEEARAAVVRELDPPAVFRAVVEAIARVLGYAHVGLYLLDGGELVLQHQVGYNRALARLPVTAGVMGRVARTGRPTLVADVTTDPDFLGAIAGVDSEVAVPLRDQGRVVGVLNVESSGGARLGGADLRLMVGLAEHVEEAIARARLFAAARDAEARLRALIERLPAVVYVLDIDPATARPSLTYVSPQAVRMIGYTAEEWLATEALWVGRLHPEDRTAILTANERSLATGEPFARDYRLLARDGREVWVHDEQVLVRDEAGMPRYWLGFMHDVTAAKRAEAALRASEEQRNLALAAAGMASWAWDFSPAGPVWSEQLVQLFGLPPGSPAPDYERYLAMIHPRDRERMRAHDEHLAAVGGDFEIEYRVVHPDGAVRWLRDVGRVECDAIGRATRVLAVTMDITARREAEAGLARERDLLRSLMDSLPDLIFFKDSHLRYLRANRAAAAAWGIGDPAAAVGKTDFDFPPADHAAAFAEDDRAVLASGEPLVNRVEPIRMPSGESRWLLTTKAPLRDESGTVERPAWRLPRHHRASSGWRRNCARATSASAAPSTMPQSEWRWLPLTAASCRSIARSAPSSATASWSCWRPTSKRSPTPTTCTPTSPRCGRCWPGSSAPTRWRSATSTKVGTSSGSCSASRWSTTSRAAPPTSSPRSRTSPSASGPSRRCAKASRTWPKPSAWPTSAAGTWTWRPTRSAGRTRAIVSSASPPAPPL